MVVGTPKINARWHRVIFNLIGASKIDQDVVEYDNKTYTYVPSSTTNQMVEDSNIWETAITHFDLFTTWKNTIMADCASRKIKPGWSSVDATQEVDVAKFLKCECGGESVGGGHSDYCPKFRS